VAGGWGGVALPFSSSGGAAFFWSGGGSRGPGPVSLLGTQFPVRQVSWTPLRGKSRNTILPEKERSCGNRQRTENHQRLRSNSGPYLIEKDASS